MSGVSAFGALPDGRAVQRITLRGGGLVAQVLTLGATLQDLRLEGVPHPLVLGAEDPTQYLEGMLYCGAIVGRFANRIGGGQFDLDGQRWQVDCNFRGTACLHGGSDGMAVQIWQIADLAEDRVVLVLDLPDGHMGFPGALRAEVTIALTGQGALCFAMQATSTAPTPCNLAHHSYFNLDDSTDARGHLLQVAADHYLAVDQGLIPVGAPEPVAGTAFDFRLARPVGDHGFDHNFCLSDRVQPLRPVASLTAPRGDLRLVVETDAPGLQVYDGAHLNGLPGLGGRRYGPHAGIALETQGWPDAPNRPDFPPAILRPGETYRHEAVYRFERVT